MAFSSVLKAKICAQKLYILPLSKLQDKANLTNLDPNANGGGSSLPGQLEMSQGWYMYSSVYHEGCIDICFQLCVERMLTVTHYHLELLLDDQITV